MQKEWVQRDYGTGYANRATNRVNVTLNRLRKLPNDARIYLLIHHYARIDDTYYELDTKQIARKKGESWGYQSAPGGWIYTKEGKPILQGWHSFFDTYHHRILREETEGLTPVRFNVYAERRPWMSSRSHGSLYLVESGKIVSDPNFFPKWKYVGRVDGVTSCDAVITFCNEHENILVSVTSQWAHDREYLCEYRLAANSTPNW